MDAIQVAGGRKELAEILGVRHTAVKKWNGLEPVDPKYWKTLIDLNLCR
jgi:DNA-binding transcriptional regulator YdaS (Cro superfamily)